MRKKKDSSQNKESGLLSVQWEDTLGFNQMVAAPQIEINLSTPALLFPAVSLLLLAYTNRFVTLANLIRSLHDKYKSEPNDVFLWQIQNLRYRVELIKYMQAAGISSMFFCVLCMFTLFAGWVEMAKGIFAFSLLLMLASLGLSLLEIWVSVKALNLHLGDLESRESKKQK